MLVISGAGQTTVLKRQILFGSKNMRIGLNYGSGYREAIDNLKKAGKLNDDGSDLEK